MILGSKLNLSGGLETPFRLFRPLRQIDFLVPVFVTTVEPDSSFQNKEDVVSSPFNLPNGLCNPIGFGKGIVDGISQFLHEALQWFVHRVPLSVDARLYLAVPLHGPVYPFRL